MDILHFITHHTHQTGPWCQEERFPWNEPGFSARMLKEHLSQETGNRSAVKIRQQACWIHEQVLGGRMVKVLDLGCGAGQHTSALADLGHDCDGVDFSPAAIAYASAAAADQGDRIRSRCTYHLQDIREVNYGTGYGLVMLIFGLFNIFPTSDARHILEKAHKALQPGGTLLLEPQSEKFIHQFGASQPEWFAARTGVFSEKPHLCLMESCWDHTSSLATRRYYIIDGASSGMTCYTSHLQAYSQESMNDLLQGCGFEAINYFSSLTGRREDAHKGLFVVTAAKPAG